MQHKFDSFIIEIAGADRIYDYASFWANKFDKVNVANMDEADAFEFHMSCLNRVLDSILEFNLSKWHGHIPGFGQVTIYNPEALSELVS
jgi:hypothetical protein